MIGGVPLTLGIAVVDGEGQVSPFGDASQAENARGKVKITIQVGVTLPLVIANSRGNNELANGLGKVRRPERNAADTGGILEDAKGLEPAVGGGVVSKVDLVKGREAVVRKVNAKLFKRCEKSLEGHLRSGEVLCCTLAHRCVNP